MYPNYFLFYLLSQLVTQSAGKIQDELLSLFCSHCLKGNNFRPWLSCRYPYLGFFSPQLFCSKGKKSIKPCPLGSQHLNGLERPMTTRNRGLEGKLHAISKIDSPQNGMQAAGLNLNCRLKTNTLVCPMHYLGHIYAKITHCLSEILN